MIFPAENTGVSSGGNVEMLELERPDRDSVEHLKEAKRQVARHKAT